MLTDLRYALSQVRHHPLIFVGVVAIISIAVAANAALFAVVDGLLLKPLPFRDSQQLVSLRLRIGQAQRLSLVDRARLAGMIETTPLLADRAVDGFAGLFDDEGDSTLVSTAVSPNFFQLLGVRPLIGAGLPADGIATDPPSVVIAYNLWQSVFGADVTVIGRPTRLQGRDIIVVGVMPRGFDFPRGTNVWSSFGRFWRTSMPSLGRLAPHTTVDQLRQALAPVEVRALRDAIRPKGSLTLVLLLGGSGFLLLIAWSQVASLQLVRFPSRSREIGVRLALGASPLHISRQFVVEGLVLSLAALALAWALVPALTALVTALLPAAMMQGQRVVADLRVFGFACGLSAVGVLVCAVGPAAWLLRHPAGNALRDEVAIGQSRPLTSRIRHVVLTSQLAVTALLLYLAGLATHAFIEIERVDLGFDPTGLFVVSLPRRGLGTDPQAATIRHQEQILALLDALRGLPGVKAVAGATTYPLRPGGFTGGLSLRNVAGWAPSTVRVNWVTPDYFRVLRLPLLAGQPLSDRTGQPRALVNQTLARAISAHAPVIGQRVVIGGFSGTVMGVVADCVSDRPDGVSEPQVYLLTEAGGQLAVVRTDDSEGSVAALQSVADRLAYPGRGDVRSIEDERRRATTDYRARMLLLVGLASVGMLVALIGVAGGLYHDVRQRTRSIALRVALGAEPRDVTWGVLRAAFAWAGVAAVGGAAGGVALGRAARTLLFEIDGFDGLTLLAVCGVLAGIAVAAAYPAVRQALAVDPASSLRHE